MAGIPSYKKEVTFYPFIETKFDVLGEAAKFSVEKITDLSDMSDVTNAATGTFVEVMATDNGHTGTVAADAAIGDTTVTITGGDTLVVGDVFDDGAGNLYYITAKTGDVIGIKGKLVAVITATTGLAFAGNTGIYRVDMQIDIAMSASVIFKHADMGHIPARYEITETTLDESKTAMDAGFDEVNDKLSNIAGGSTMVVVG